MSLKLVTPPTTEPVTLSELKAWARIDINDDDELIVGLISSARSLSETFTRRSFINTTWRYSLDVFPNHQCLVLPQAPLSSVTTLKYYDTNGVLQTYSSSLYSVDTESEPGRIYLNPSEVWPNLQNNKYSAVQVNYVSGYGVDASFIPEDIKTAIKMLASHWYDVRPAVSMESLNEVPMAYSSLLWPFKVHRFHT